MINDDQVIDEGFTPLRPMAALLDPKRMSLER
jgi:hypothetical protein